MSAADLPDWLARFDSGHYRPVTFLERGIALPFNTPHLPGGRIRLRRMDLARAIEIIAGPEAAAAPLAEPG
jgi:hypothetical protein